MKLMCPHVSLAILLTVLASPPAIGSQPPGSRNSDGLHVLYDFSEGSGQILHNHSGTGIPLDLSIENSPAVKWSEGHLNIAA